MVAGNLSPDELAKLARQVYSERLRARLEPHEDGKFVVINLDTGEYEVDADDLTASDRARSRFGDAPLFVLRVGRPAAYHLGGAFRTPSA